MLSKKLFCLVVFTILCVLFVSCGTIPGAVGLVELEQIPTSIPTAQIVQSFAMVESIEIQILESLPIQVDVVSRGYLPDSCTYIQTTNQDQKEQFISISILTSRPSNVECTPQNQPFELHTKLDGNNLIPGKYTVSVNGVIGAFEIPLEQATTIPNASLSGIVWHDLCAVGGGEDGVPLTPSAGCAPAGKSFRANGFMETGEPGLEGVSVRLGLGDCPTNGNVTTTTSQNGEYVFDELKPGKYCVSIEPLDPNNTNILVPGEWSSPAQTFWALIKVVVPNNNYSYDFAANYCRASWSSDAGTLNCPGRTSSTQGFVILFDNPTLENRNENEPALWVRPNHNKEGWISGKYPPITIRDGDHFKAWVGCLAESKGCDVTFTLSYVTDDGHKNSLGQWHEIFDKEVTKIDLDLSFISKKNVALILSTEINNKNYDMANAFWFVPRIESQDTNDIQQGKAIQAARQSVAAGIGVPNSDLRVIQVGGPLTWNDSCLEVKLEDVVCTKQEIRGYQILISYAGVIYEARTNMDGTLVYWFY